MRPYPFPSGEHTMFSTTLLHGEECLVTNRRIIVMSPEGFHQVPLCQVIRVTAHVEAYLPWLNWARFFPVRVYRGITDRVGPELVLECTTQAEMLALVDAIKRSALLTSQQGRAASSKEEVINDDVPINGSVHIQPAWSADEPAHHAA